MPFITVNDTELYYELSGDGNIPLALVHGSWGDHTNWKPVVGELARSFRVLTYDRSLAVHEPPLFGLLVEDPESAMVVRAIEERMTNVLQLLRAGNFRNAARHFVDTVALGPGAWDKLPPTRQATFVNNAPTFLDELHYPDIAIVDLEALGRFDRPTLLTRGERSPAFFPAVVGKIAAAMPGAEEVVFAGAAHTPHVSHPAEFIETISEFVRRHESRLRERVGL